MDEKSHEFIKVKVNAPYAIGKTILNQNYSRDGGDSFHMEENQILFGTYYFL